MPALETKAQPDAFTTPWSRGERVRIAVWHAVRTLFFRPTPKPLNGWRLALLRLFGARISGRPFIAASARVMIPWNLTMKHRACLGARVDAYNLGMLILRERCTVAQDVMLCGGGHDTSTRRLPLVVGPIDIGADAFVGARALILPGLKVGEGAVVGAGSVVSRDVSRWTIVAGNPARKIRDRVLVEENV